jgi:hypothetical protein
MKSISWYLVARVSREETDGELFLPLFFPHLPKGIGEVEGADLFGILELEELVSAVARHVDEDVTSLVGHQALAPGHVLAHAVCHEADEVLDGDFVASVIDLDVVAIQIERTVGVVVDGAGEGVAGVARHVIGQHEDDLRIRDAEALDGAIEGEDICQVAVVEPESRGAHEDGPVGRVLTRDQGGRQQRNEGAEDAEELHVGDPTRTKMTLSSKARVAVIWTVLV